MLASISSRYKSLQARHDTNNGLSEIKSSSSPRSILFTSSAHSRSQPGSARAAQPVELRVATEDSRELAPHAFCRSDALLAGAVRACSLHAIGALQNLQRMKSLKHRGQSSFLIHVAGLEPIHRPDHAMQPYQVFLQARSFQARMHIAQQLGSALGQSMGSTH